MEKRDSQDNGSNLDDSDYQPPLPPRVRSATALTTRIGISTEKNLEPRGINEIKESFYSGMLTELHFFNQSYRYDEKYIVLTRDKWLKFYYDITSTVPEEMYYAFNVQVIEETGTDPVILRLHMEKNEKERLFKASDESECLAWKNAFDKIHYEEIDDIITTESVIETEQKITEEKISEKMFRKRGKTSDKRDKTEPVLLSLNKTAQSKTLPHLGRMKKRAKELKEEKEKSKSLVSQNSIDMPSSQRKGLSSLIRSFTVDTLTRKAKNKSYEVQKDDDILIKETQHGLIQQVILKDGNERLEDRFCKISGKVFYCFIQEADKKPIIKIPLRNAAIEEFPDSENSTYRFQLTAMDTGAEYLFSLKSEDELEIWASALYGEDKLHSSYVESSPTGSNYSLSSETRSPKIPLASPLTSSSRFYGDGVLDESANSSSNVEVHRNNDTLVTNRSSLASGSVSSRESILDDGLPEEGNKLRTSSVYNESTSSLASSVTTSRSTLSENDYKMSPFRKLSLLQPLLEENIKLNHLMFQVRESESSQTKTRRWLVLRRTVLEIYNNENDRRPIQILHLSKYVLVNEDTGLKNSHFIKLKPDEGSIIQFVAPSDAIHKLWVSELKRIQKRHSSSTLPSKSLPNVVKRKGVNDRLRDLKSGKDKRASMVLVDDDIKAIEKYEDSANPANTISGKFFLLSIDYLLLLCDNTIISSSHMLMNSFQFPFL